MASVLGALLMKAFPDASRLCEDCWVSKAIGEEQDAFGDALSVVTALGGESALIDRLRAEHPTDRCHRREYDDRLMEVFTEAEAFAWAAEVGRLGRPEFVTSEGAPDLRAGSWWIEAKTINESDVERAARDALQPALDSVGIVMRGPVELAAPHPGLLRKFEYQLDDGVKKWQRQGTGGLAVFYEWVSVDFGTSDRQAEAEVRDWARSAERCRDVCVVVSFNYGWNAPLYPGSIR